MSPRVTCSLIVKCPTWDHVEAFYRRKVKEGLVTARVPFQAAPGDVVALALELPDQVVVSMDGRVEEAAPAPDGKKTSIRLRIIGLTPFLRGRLEALVAEARGEGAAGAAAPRAASPGPAASPATSPAAANRPSPPGAAGAALPGRPPGPPPRRAGGASPASVAATGSPAPERAPPRPDSARAGAPAGSAERTAADVMAEARQLMAAHDWPRAREVLAESLRRRPRNRNVRALFHLASAESLLAEGKPAEARNQLEVALAHDPGLDEARAVIERMRQKSTRHGTSLLRRFFR